MQNRGKALTNAELKELAKARRRASKKNLGEAQRAERKLDQQKAPVRTRAKFGAAMQPGVVTVKTLDGQVLGQYQPRGGRKPLTDRQRKLIESLREETGNDAKALPATSYEGSHVIRQLLQRKESLRRTELRRQRREGAPSKKTSDLIVAAGLRLGHLVEVPETEGEAINLLNELRREEKKRRRTADGSAG